MFPSSSRTSVQGLTFDCCTEDGEHSVPIGPGRGTLEGQSFNKMPPLSCITARTSRICTSRFVRRPKMLTCLFHTSIHSVFMFRMTQNQVNASAHSRNQCASSLLCRPKGRPAAARPTLATLCCCHSIFHSGLFSSFSTVAKPDRVLQGKRL